MIKRYDKDGNLLQKGESQRKDGRYVYRYQDELGKTKSIYAKTLPELRNKEVGSQVQYGIKVSDYIERYFYVLDVRENTKRTYLSKSSIIKKTKIYNMNVTEIKRLYAKQYLIALKKEYGYSVSTVKNIKSILFQSLEIARDDEVITSNPFDFQIRCILKEDKKERTPLSKAEEKEYMEYTKEIDIGCYYVCVVLLHTGLRVSEFCALTMNDIDLETRVMQVTKQINKDGTKVVLPKSRTSNRCIYIDDECYEAICKLKEMSTPVVFDGYSRFLYTPNNKVVDGRKVSYRIQEVNKKILKLYGKDYKWVTPHIFRHTFATNLARAGINVKALQSVMGHSKVTTTMDLYTHINNEIGANMMKEFLTQII